MPEPAIDSPTVVGGPAEPGAAAEVSLDGRATRWTGQQERRRAEFVEAALSAIEEHGPDVSTEQIAAYAGVARTRLYRHFAGAQELDQQIAAYAEEMLLHRLTSNWDVNSSPDTIIRTAVSTHLQWLTDHRQLYLYLVRHAVTTPDGTPVVNDVKQIMADLLTALLEQWADVLDIELLVVRPLAHGLVGFVDAAADRWVVDPGGTSADELVDLLAEWLWSVISATLAQYEVTLDPSTPLTEA